MIRASLHVAPPPLPGDPLHVGVEPAVICERLLADALALRDGGVDALLLENYGSMPFWRAIFATLCHRTRSRS